MGARVNAALGAYHCEVGRETTAKLMPVFVGRGAYHCEVGRETTAFQNLIIC